MTDERSIPLDSSAIVFSLSDNGKQLNITFVAPKGVDLASAEVINPPAHVDLAQEAMSYILSLLDGFGDDEELPDLYPTTDEPN